MAVTVTVYVRPIVKTTLVTFNMEIAIPVNQDGMGQLVAKVYQLLYDVIFVHNVIQMIN